MPLRLLTADRGDHALRLDLMLRRHLTDVSSATRTRVQAWIRAGRVSVNGQCVSRVSSRAMAGDVVSVALPVEVPRAVMAAEARPVVVLYEDPYLLAVSKPVGIVAHPTHRNLTGTLMNALLWHARDWTAPLRPSLVSRLDKCTSGVVIVAKSAAAHTALQRSMAARDCEKDYLAVVYGRLPVGRGDVDLRLRRDPIDRRRVVASPTLGSPSLTRFERLARVAAPRVGLSLVRCRLVTGRTHQIRVHLASHGWPIVGDPVYGAPRWSEIADVSLAATLRRFPRQALHAWRVALTHPFTGARLVAEAPLPDDMTSLMATTGLTAAWSPVAVHGRVFQGVAHADVHQ